MSTRDLILGANDLELSKVVVPHWKDKHGKPIEVYVKQLSCAVADEYIKVVQSDTTGLLKGVHAIVSSVCDSEGNLIFNKDDVDLLMGKNPKAINYLAEEVLKIIFKKDEDIEELAKE